MSHTDMSRRGLLKTSFLGAAGAAAAGATGFRSDIAALPTLQPREGATL